MLLLHSHLEHHWHLIFAKIMNNMLFWGFILNLYTHTSSLCCMVLLGTPPTSFLLNFRGSPFFFSGLTAGPTYRPPVRHSNPDTPLVRSVISLIFVHKPSWTIIWVPQPNQTQDVSAIHVLFFTANRWSFTSTKFSWRSQTISMYTGILTSTLSKNASRWGVASPYKNEAYLYGVLVTAR